jgi:hypothetical protein
MIYWTRFDYHKDKCVFVGRNVEDQKDERRESNVLKMTRVND